VSENPLPQTAPPRSAFTELIANKNALLIPFLAVLFLTIAYVRFTGLIVIMGDTMLLASRAKNLVSAFDLSVTQGFSPAVYPPLYSIVLAFAYLFQDPDSIFNATLAFHVLLTSSQLFPLFLLLSQYGRLSPRPAAALAAALALSPATLPYTSIALTEVLYAPLLLWLAYFLSRIWIAGDSLKYVPAGLLLAAGLLTRSAAAAAILSFALTSLLLLWFQRKDPAPRKASQWGSALAALAFSALYGSWLLYEAVAVSIHNPSFQVDWADKLAILHNSTRIDLHVSWFSNSFFYYLAAPLSLAGPFSFVLFLRRPSLLRRDPLALFFLLSLLSAAASASFLMNDFWGGKDLTWSRYLMPYVIFQTLLAVRYRDHLNRATLFASTLLLAAACLAFRPSSLACHFIDALALAAKNRPLPASDAVINILFFTVPVLAASLWLHSPLGRRLALSLTALFWLATHFAAAGFYRHSGDLNISNYQGIATLAYRIAQEKGSQVFYDPDADVKDPFAAERILYYWPNLDIRPLPPAQLSQLKIPRGSSVLYFSSNPVAGLQPLGQDRNAVRLYEITPQSPSASSAHSLSTIAGPNLPGPEFGDKDGRKVSVRWLGKGADFFIDSPAGAADVNIQLTLGTFGAPRTATLLVNGAPAAPTYRVEGDFWGAPPTIATFRARLNPGRNRCEITAPEPPSALPDGRPVLFLLVGEIAVEPVTNTSK
jgi:hypothetical protein